MRKQLLQIQENPDLIDNSFVDSKTRNTKLTDMSQAANIVTDQEEELHIQNQIITNTVTQNRLLNQTNYHKPLKENTNITNLKLNSHLRALSQIQLSSREKQIAWQNLKIEGMSFSKPEDEQLEVAAKRKSLGNGELESRNERVLKEVKGIQFNQDRENLVINHILSSSDLEKPQKQQFMNTQQISKTHMQDRPSQFSDGRSFTQFEAQTPISFNCTEQLNLNSQRPQSTAKITKKCLNDSQRDQDNADMMVSQPEENRSNEKYVDENQKKINDQVPSIHQQEHFHELQASPHNQTKDTERFTTLQNYKQYQQQFVDHHQKRTRINYGTQGHTIETNQKTIGNSEMENSQNCLSQQQILKNIFFSKDSLQNPQIIKQNDQVRIENCCLKFKSILSSFSEDQLTEDRQNKNDLKDIQLNLVQVTEQKTRKSKYLLQLSISNTSKDTDDQSNSQCDKKIDTTTDNTSSQNFSNGEVLQDQLKQLEPENKFDEVYNQVNELMINNLINDQQLAVSKQMKLNGNQHSHFLLLGNGQFLPENDETYP